MRNGRAHSADPDNDEEDVGAGNGAPTMTTPLLSLFAIIRLVYLLLKRKYIYQHKTLIFHFPERNTKFSDSWLARVASWGRTSASRR